MLGFTPKEDRFTFKEGPFLKLVRDAATDPDGTYVLVIDELSQS